MNKHKSTLLIINKNKETYVKYFTEEITQKILKYLNVINTMNELYTTNDIYNFCKYSNEEFKLINTLLYKLKMIDSQKLESYGMNERILEQYIKELDSINIDGMTKVEKQPLRFETNIEKIYILSVFP